MYENSITHLSNLRTLSKFYYITELVAKGSYVISDSEVWLVSFVWESRAVEARILDVANRIYSVYGDTWYTDLGIGIMDDA
jgi:hypothetical protein